MERDGKTKLATPMYAWGNDSLELYQQKYCYITSTILTDPYGTKGKIVTDISWRNGLKLFSALQLKRLVHFQRTEHDKMAETLKVR